MCAVHPDVQLLTRAGSVRYQARHLVPAVDSTTRGGTLDRAVTVSDGVRGEQIDQILHVPATRDRVKEALRELVAPPFRDLESHSFLSDALAPACRELPAVRLSLADDLGDLEIAEVEDVVEQKHRTLNRSKALQEQQE
jgi:hypothetical protein